MAIYKLDIEKKFGQLRFRLYPQSGAPSAFGGDATDVRGLIENLDAALTSLDIDSGADSVFFRNIEYAETVALRETVRHSRF